MRYTNAFSSPCSSTTSLPKLRARRRARLVLPTPIGPSTTMKRWGAVATLSVTLDRAPKRNQFDDLFKECEAFGPRARRQHFDPSRFGDEQLGRDIPQRIQDEIASSQARMRDRQV